MASLPHNSGYKMAYTIKSNVISWPQSQNAEEVRYIWDAFIDNRDIFAKRITVNYRRKGAKKYRSWGNTLRKMFYETNGLVKYIE